MNRMEGAVSTGIEYIMEQWKIKNGEASSSLNQKRADAAQAAKEEEAAEGETLEPGQQKTENSGKEPGNGSERF